ncbi:hypothetical protein [Pedobacter gandavensis]|uniref:hypothetical protein n=1 Tax=Pedobacter gandavensis TaxID=2679963 RepID=UPI00292CD665|nr:hypothetical protein [Pedobacter gandavensis]
MKKKTTALISFFILINISVHAQEWPRTIVEFDYYLGHKTSDLKKAMKKGGPYMYDKEYDEKKGPFMMRLYEYKTYDLTLYCLDDKVVGLICKELTKSDALAMEAALKNNGYKLTQNLKYMGGFPANYANLWTSADGNRQCRVVYKGFADSRDGKPYVDTDILDFVALTFATDIIALAIDDK